MVACTSSLIKALLTGEIDLPDVVQVEIAAQLGVIPPAPDEEHEKLKNRLANASRILKSKRARIH